MSNPLKKIAIIVNPTKPLAPEVADNILKICKKNNVETKISSGLPIPENFFKDCCACCVIGGDGTLLNVVPEAYKFNTPIISVNLGKLGFLSTFTYDEALEKLVSILKGNYIISPRTLIECTTADAQKIIALNDIVIKHSMISRLACLEVKVNDETVTKYYGDGLIFSTPTGSTAYNLSAGGPIIYPDAGVFCMTPINPHKLTNRSVVFDNKISLSVLNANTDYELYVSVDGSTKFINSNVFPLKINMSSKSAYLIELPEYSYFKMLRSKLNWS